MTILKNVTYFDSFGIGHIPKETKKFIENENITTNIYRTQLSNIYSNIYLIQ